MVYYMTSLEIGDLVTPAKGPWHGLVGRVTSNSLDFFEDPNVTTEVLVEFDEPIENRKGMPTFDRWFEPEDLIKLDKAGKLLYV